MVGKLCFFSWLVLVFSRPAFAQTETLMNRLTQIAQLNETVGYSTALVTSDSVLIQFNTGLRDLQRELPINDSTMFRFASVSKTVTALGMLKLVEQNKLDLDEDISTYLGFELRNPRYATEQITSRKLLSHTSSLRDSDAYDSFLSATYAQENIPPIQELVTPFGTFYNSSVFSTLYGPDSDYFTYANINYGLIGTIIEQITNQRFDIYLRDSVLTPLGIPGGYSIHDVEDINQVAVLYRFSANRWRPQAENYQGVKPDNRALDSYEPGTNALVFAPQGGLRTTVSGLSKLIQMLLNNGGYNGKRFVSEATVDLLLNPFWEFNGSNGDTFYDIFENYALGTHSTSRLLSGFTLTGHPGESYGLISDMYIERDKGFGILFVTNGGRWGFGSYSGWYSIEEQVFTAWKTYIETQSVSVEPEFDGTPNRIQLKIFPNPFNPTATVEVSIPQSGMYSIEIYSLLGQLINWKQSNYMEEGIHQFPLNGHAYASGIYILRVTGSASESSTRFHLIK